MDNWDQKIKQKLADYQYLEEPSDQQVSAFFEEMDHKSRGLSYFALRIAASIALLLGVVFVGFQLAKETVSIAAGETLSITLPDGSLVALNEKSTLEYNKMGWLFARSLSLDGEAFFQVKKGSAFVVNSENGTTEVLGTSFNINTRKDKYAVKCYTGKVSVTAGNKKQTLTRGDAVAFTTNDIIDQYSFDPGKAGGWQSGEYQFDNEALTVVLFELSQAYGIEVFASDSIKDLKYSGYFPTEDLDLSLKLICDPLNLTFTLKGEEVRLINTN